MNILLISPKNVYATKRLSEEARKHRVTITNITVHELARQKFAVDLSSYDALYIRQAFPHYDQVAALARQAANLGLRVIDRNIVTHGLGHGKMDMLAKLGKCGIPIPKTKWLNDVLIENVAHPFVLKWNYGFGARHVFLIKDQTQLEMRLKHYKPAELLAQQFIPTRWEYKVFTVGYKSLPIVLRVPSRASGFLTDFSGASIVSKNDVLELVNLAEIAATVMGRELAKTDVVEDHQGNLSVLEVNRWPGFQVFEEITGYNVARDFIRYIHAQTIGKIIFQKEDNLSAAERVAKTEQIRYNSPT
jgi:glutathione synthase/RimK-type ligase-like ATP-grasp enzyme